MSDNLADLIAAAQRRLERINDNIDNYSDQHWLAERTRKLVYKRDATETEIRVLSSAQHQLKEMEGTVNG